MNIYIGYRLLLGLLSGHRPEQDRTIGLVSKNVLSAADLSFIWSGCSYGTWSWTYCESKAVFSLCGQYGL